MAIELLAYAQLFTNHERWSGSVSSPRGKLVVDISDDAQGDLGAAIGEVLVHLHEVWSINRPTDWEETAPGIWTADLTDSGRATPPASDTKDRSARTDTEDFGQGPDQPIGPQIFTV